MAKKEQKQEGKIEGDVLDQNPEIKADSNIPEGSVDVASGEGEEKGEGSPEKPLDSEADSKVPEVSKKSEEKRVDSRRLKISALVSGQLFAAGMKAEEIPLEALELIPSKYFEEMK